MRDIILADNQDITRAGLKSVIEDAALSVQVTECGDLKSLGSLLSGSPDAVIILDYTLFDFYGIEQMLNLASRYDHTSWLLFSEELGRSFIRSVGARERFGIVMKSSPIADIKSAISDTIAYRAYFCPFAARIMEEEPYLSQEERLTSSETSILREIAMGRTTKEIAAGRCLSFHTVNSHRKNIFRKLGVNNVQEAIRYALRAGVIDMADYNI